MAVHKPRTTAADETHDKAAADDPIVVSSVGPPLPAGDVSEYEMPDGTTYLLSEDDAKRRGAKAVNRPANKAITPQNK